MCHSTIPVLTIVLLIRTGFIDLYLNFLTRKTGSIWWTILMHTLGGFIMILLHERSDGSNDQRRNP